MSLMTSTPASISRWTLARASSAPSTPQRNVLLVVEVRPLLDERPGDEEPRSRDLARLDAALDVEDVLERRAQVAHGGDARHQELLRAAIGMISSRKRGM